LPDWVGASEGLEDGELLFIGTGQGIGLGRDTDDHSGVID
jgi:hypothetical protein